jgi:putative membrane protein
MVTPLYSDTDRVNIREAVEQAERRSRGEIVPVVVSASARYRDAAHLAGLLAAVLALTSLLVIGHSWTPWAWMERHPGWIVLGTVLAYALGHAIGRHPWGIRFFTSRARMAQKVTLRAELAFYQHGLHKTAGRTGILIFISTLERQVRILADTGIHQLVAPGTWDRMVEHLVEGIKTGHPTDALCQAIDQCGDVLARHFPVDGDNPNELPDDIVQDR